jgi:hypothetical protein
MPIDASQLRAQIIGFADGFDESRKRRADVVADLLKPLEADYTQADAFLAASLAAASVQGLRWSGALFTQGEAISQQFSFDALPERYALIATDGSQILPDRHKPFQFAYVQAGCACVTYGSADQSLGKALSQMKRSRFIPEAELYDEQTGELRPPSEISNQRDALEIALLAEACQMASDAGYTPIAVADGSIVPFALLGGRNVKQLATKLLPPITRALDAIQASGALVCGYIDKPNSNALARACALEGKPFDQISDGLLRANDGRIAGIVDRHLMEIALAPAHRTALFDPNWEVNDVMGMHAMRACYVNFGAGAGIASVVGRIEVPQWCTSHIGVLAAVLHRHANMGEGYPLILKAAHQESVVGKDDARDIESAIQQELLKRGIVPRGSYKQDAKDRG